MSSVNSANIEAERERKRAEIRARCKEKGIAILPYGAAWWLKGENFSLVLYDLANIDVGRLDRECRHLTTKGTVVRFK